MASKKTKVAQTGTPIELAKTLIVNDQEYNINAKKAEQLEKSLKFKAVRGPATDQDTDTDEVNSTEFAFDGSKGSGDVGIPVVSYVSADSGGYFKNYIGVPDLKDIIKNKFIPEGHEVLNHNDIKNVVTQMTGAGWYTWILNGNEYKFDTVKKENTNQHLGIVVGDDYDLHGAGFAKQNYMNKFLPMYLYIASDTGNIYYGTSDSLNYIQLSTVAKKLESDKNSYTADDISNIISEIYTKINTEISKLDANVVKKSGADQTMTAVLETPAIRVYKSKHPTIGFYNQNMEPQGLIALNTTDNNNRIQLSQRATGASYAENYRLPARDENLDSEKWYTILTDKTPVTVKEGGTGANNAANAAKNIIENQSICPSKISVYTKNQYATSTNLNNCGLDLNSSDIKDVYGIRFSGYRQFAYQGILFKNNASNSDAWDKLFARDGKLFFAPYAEDGKQIAQEVYHKGNLLAYVEKTGDTMSGQLVVPYLKISKPINEWSSLALCDNDDLVLGGISLSKCIQGDSSKPRNLLVLRQATISSKDKQNYPDIVNNIPYENYYLPSATMETITKKDDLEALKSKTYYILTTKEPVTIAQGGTGATSAPGAREAIGAVSKYGDTMSGTLEVPYLKISKETENWSSIEFRDSTTNKTVGSISLSKRSVAGTGYVSENRLVFCQNVLNSNYRERYYLPSTASSATADKSYDILTTKDVVLEKNGGTGKSSLAEVTVGAATNATNATNDSTGRKIHSGYYRTYNDTSIGSNMSTEINTIRISSSDPSGGNNGDIWIKYSN